ncbi:hypothetical protein PM082_015392 [Marasmius tenuissimus]|nr:hypothetical protein PM082_015392 [Marasmius tenuissimus]
MDDAPRLGFQTLDWASDFATVAFESLRLARRHIFLRTRHANEGSKTREMGQVKDGGCWRNQRLADRTYGGCASRGVAVVDMGIVRILSWRLKIAVYRLMVVTQPCA